MVFQSGKGAIHMEETGQSLFDDGGSYHGFQIWLNMPSKYKFMNPSTAVHRDKALPNIETKDYSVKVILGELFDTKSSVELLSPAFYYHVKLNPNSKITIPTDPGHNAFVYGIKGESELENRKAFKANQIALYERGDSEIDIYSECGAEFLVLGGQPLDEVVYSYGPFVMNTKAQIDQCIRDYRSGKMGDPRKVN